MELDLALEDLLINCHGVIVVERVNACHHLVGEDIESPPAVPGEVSDNLVRVRLLRDQKCSVLAEHQVGVAQVGSHGARADLIVLCHGVDPQCLR